MILLITAAVAFSLLVLAWVIYPAAMRLRAGSTRAEAVETGGPDERVAVILATRDDPAFAVTRVQNLRANDYPESLLRVVVGVDVNSMFPLDAYRQVLAGLAGGVSFMNTDYSPTSFRVMRVAARRCPRTLPCAPRLAQTCWCLPTLARSSIEKRSGFSSLPCVTAHAGPPPAAIRTVVRMASCPPTPTSRR